jgi:hypothetical protein
LTTPEVPEVSAQVELKVKVWSGQDPDALERAIAAEGRRAAKELYLRVIETKDEQAVATAGGVRQRREARWVATLFGRVRIHRYRINNEVESFHPLDRALGLRRSEASQTVRRLIVALSKRFSYRDTARVMSEITGESFSYQHVARLLREDAS